jgi:hypothetical protein
LRRALADVADPLDDGAQVRIATAFSASRVLPRVITRETDRALQEAQALVDRA